MGRSGPLASTKGRRRVTTSAHGHVRDTRGRWRRDARWVRQPAVLTTALTACITAVGLLFLPTALSGAPLLPLGGGSTLWVMVLALALAFFVTELGQALIEFRQQAYSLSLSGIPLLLGLLYCPPQHLLVARVLAATAAFAVQRATVPKFAFNTASYLLDTALVLSLTHVLVGPEEALTLRVVALCYLSLAVVDLLMSSLVLLVIRINDGPLTAADATGVLLPAAGFVALSTAIGALCAQLLSGGTLGQVLLVAFVVITAGVYRGYLVLRRRHQSLQVDQQMIEGSDGAGTLDEIAVRMLDQIRELVRATRFELTLRDVEGALLVRVL